jgi:GGDEF domain-containing protein
MVRKRLAVAQEPVSLGGQTIEVGVSAGIAMYPDDGQDTDTLMRRADRAMYTVKRRHHVPARESEPTLT